MDRLIISHNEECVLINDNINELVELKLELQKDIEKIKAKAKQNIKLVDLVDYLSIYANRVPQTFLPKCDRLSECVLRNICTWLKCMPDTFVDMTDVATDEFNSPYYEYPYTNIEKMVFLFKTLRDNNYYHAIEQIYAILKEGVLDNNDIKEKDYPPANIKNEIIKTIQMFVKP